MTWLLDTNVWVAYLNPRPSPVRQRLAQAARNLRTLSELFSTVDSLAFDGPAADAFGRLRAHLASRGTPIGPYDLQIAAIALANDLTLVTHNTREFARVPDLRLADWEA